MKGVFLPPISKTTKMRKIIFGILCVALVGCGNGKQQQNETEMEKKHELTSFDVRKEFAENGFTFFTDNMVVCTGDREMNNAMTIGSGSIGNYLGVECETMTEWHTNPEDFRNGTPAKWYEGFDAGYHTVFIGQVVGAWKR